MRFLLTSALWLLFLYRVYQLRIIWRHKLRLERVNNLMEIISRMTHPVFEVFLQLVLLFQQPN
jgi:hypothetical protein